VAAARTGTAPDLFWTIGGTLHSKKPLDMAGVRLTLVEQGQAVTVPARWPLHYRNLKAGDYTLEVAADGGQPRRYKVTVRRRTTILKCETLRAACCVFRAPSRITHTAQGNSRR